LVHVLCDECFSHSGEFLRVFFIPKFGLFAFVYPRLAKQGNDARHGQIFPSVHFLAKFSQRAECTARPKAMFPVGASGTFKPYLNHQRI
jgi:hypothetical protein